MKTKVYKVELKNPTGDEDTLYYLVDAPSKRVAKWCGSALYNNEYFTFLSAKDMKATRFTLT